MTALLGLNDNVLELNDHSLITSLCARTMREWACPWQGTLHITLPWGRSTRFVIIWNSTPKSLDFQQKTRSVKSQRYGELHDTGAATVRATIHRSSRIRLL